MSTTKFGGTGHGMPEPLPRDVEKQLQAKEAEKRKKQTEEFAKDSLPKKGTTTTTIHESKHFPFVIIEHEVTNNETEESVTTFHIGCQGQIVSQKHFESIEKAEKYLNTRPWEIITNFVLVTFKNAFEYEKSQS